MRRAANTPPEQVRATIWDQLDEKANGPVSVSETIRTVRRMVPGYSGTDRELAALIGALATAAGRNVHFDKHAE